MNLREQLLSIYNAHGSLTPASVVDAARSPEHPLHHRFEWDDAVAGEKYRQHQARELIRSVRVVEADGLPNESVRAFHSMPSVDGQSYRPIEEIRTDPVATAVLLREAEREWRQLYRRFSHLAEWLGMIRGDVAA